ncbi:response regulator [Olivibacter sp. SDN3]|uniref:response regulator n=1 Tax=Olivibacter sp. SDN3 TaxID=2764720 RepID=UPI0016512887|nr:response regulator [Olivibacter sp. SDN3]QNL47974.1 response regulator [Olivibacter sp. SDN3]
MKATKSVLYIEDDDSLQSIILDILKDEDVQVVMDSGENLFSLLKKHNFGLILMDERLNGCQGSDLCKKLKADRNYRDIPVIMISASWDIPHIAKDCLADGYIRKPFDIYDIIATVNLNYSDQNKTKVIPSSEKN